MLHHVHLLDAKYDYVREAAAWRKKMVSKKWLAENGQISFINILLLLSQNGV